MGLVLHLGDSHVEGLEPFAGEAVAAFGDDYRAEYERGVLTPAFARSKKAQRLASDLQPSEVWLTFGTNDVGVPDGSEAAAISDIVSQIRSSKPDAKIVIWSPPKMRKEPYASNALRVAALQLDAAKSLGLDYVDSRRYTERGLKPEGVHFTRAGYEAWGRRAAWESIFATHSKDVVPGFLIAIAQHETRPPFNPASFNPESGASGLFQSTAVNRRDYNIAHGTELTAEDLKDASTALKVEVYYLTHLVFPRLRREGAVEDWKDRLWVSLAALAHNVGSAGVGRAIQRVRAEGLPLTLENVAAKLPAERQGRITFAKNVARSYFTGGPPPVLPEPAPGRLRPREIAGAGAAVLLAGGILVAVIFSRGR